MRGIRIYPLKEAVIVEVKETMLDQFGNESKVEQAQSKRSIFVDVCVASILAREEFCSSLGPSKGRVCLPKPADLYTRNGLSPSSRSPEQLPARIPRVASIAQSLHQR